MRGKNLLDTRVDDCGFERVLNSNGCYIFRTNIRKFCDTADFRLRKRSIWTENNTDECEIKTNRGIVRSGTWESLSVVD